MSGGNDLSHDQITGALEAIVLVRPQDEHEALIVAWYAQLSAEAQGYARRLITIYKARNQTIINTGTIFQANRLTMTIDKSVKVDTKGGDIVGAAVGAGAKVDAGFIQVLKGNVDSSANIDAKGQALFKECIDELSSQGWEKRVTTEVLEELEKLRKEVTSPKPSEGIVKKCWGAIWGMAGALPTVAKLGTWLAGTFSWFPSGK